MREIEFRGQTGHGRWIYGSLVYSESVQPAIYFETGHGEVKTMDWAYVKPDTVGQYTGLRDKNGKKIYEGDIVIESECLPGDNIPRVVKWERGAFICSYIKKHWATGDNNVPFQFLYDLKNGGIEVIGNIHDNPELLRIGREEKQ